MGLPRGLSKRIAASTVSFLNVAANPPSSCFEPNTFRRASLKKNPYPGLIGTPIRDRSWSAFCCASSA
ncbi:hypothetical protein [Lysobacter gummosus]|uniref:hypothetical protein n=1 Tax=Lysobacter gummosus TaxID=262324 RepID=UPI00363955BE